MTPTFTVFSEGLSRWTDAAMELLGPSFGGIVVGNRFLVYKLLLLELRKLCWADIIRDLTPIDERPGGSRAWSAVAEPAATTFRAMAPLEARGDQPKKLRYHYQLIQGEF